ncbi:MAG: hypothetical protein IPI10_15310 [Bacteroidetes bacterium]|nr:hypothetical protein [Bacteroidota bacterium]
MDIQGEVRLQAQAQISVIRYNTTGQFDVQLIVVNALGSDTLTQHNTLILSFSYRS